MKVMAEWGRCQAHCQLSGCIRPDVQCLQQFLVEEFHIDEECLRLHCHLWTHSISDRQVGVAAATEESRQVSAAMKFILSTPCTCRVFQKKIYILKIK